MVLILAIFTILFTTIIIVFITGTLNSLNISVPTNHIQEKHFNQSLTKHIILTSIVAPIFEELTFRAWLFPLRIYISVALYCITYLFAAYNYNDSIFYYLSFSFPTIVIVALYSSLNMFYFSFFSFQIFHFFNFDKNLNLLLLTFITLPQLLAGIILSYTRLKYGLMYSMFLHIVNNLVFVIINRI